MELRNLKLGVYGGLAGGLVFGAMMGMMGMLPMIGMMVGLPSALAGFVVHLAISAFIGISFVVILGRFAQSPAGGFGYGLLYGGVWWILGPLTLMPLMMGMGLGVNWNSAAVANMLPSLIGHLVYGAILGLTYGALTHRSPARQPACNCC